MQRPLRVRGQNERALMAERGGGLARRTLGLGALCLRNLGQDLRGERAVPRFELGDRPPRRLGVPRIEREHGLGDQRLDAVALLQREPVAILLRAARQLAGDQRRRSARPSTGQHLVLAQRPARQRCRQAEQHDEHAKDRQDVLKRRPIERKDAGEGLHGADRTLPVGLERGVADTTMALLGL